MSVPRPSAIYAYPQATANIAQTKGKLFPTLAPLASKIRNAKTPEDVKTLVLPAITAQQLSVLNALVMMEVKRVSTEKAGRSCASDIESLTGSTGCSSCASKCSLGGEI